MGVADQVRIVDMELELDARFEHREEDMSWLEEDRFEQEEDYERVQ